MSYSSLNNSLTIYGLQLQTRRNKLSLLRIIYWLFYAKKGTHLATFSFVSMMELIIAVYHFAAKGESKSSKDKFGNISPIIPRFHKQKTTNVRTNQILIYTKLDSA